MREAGRLRRWVGMGATIALSLLMLGSGDLAFAAPGGFHGGGGGFHGGGGFRGGPGVRAGGFRAGPGFRAGGFRGGPEFSAGGFRGGPGWRGGPGFYGHGGYGPGWGAGPWWQFGLGLYLSVLPWYCTTYWWDGVPYYYVENDYYVWDPDESEYEQVQPPPQVTQQAQSGQPSQAPPQLYAYPKKGQSAQQQATDKRQCGRWATSQTGVNPAAAAGAAPQTAPTTANGNGVEPEQGAATANGSTSPNAQQWQNYLRAEGACLEARGYTVE